MCVCWYVGWFGVCCCIWVGVVWGVGMMVVYVLVSEGVVVVE